MAFVSIDWVSTSGAAGLALLCACTPDGPSSDPTSSSTSTSTGADESGTSGDDGDSSADESSSGGSDGNALQEALEFRLDGDRTGACIAAAVIDAQVERAIVCAGEPRPLTTESAFEIGSITKTMTALLLAEQIEAGTLDLDDPLEAHLPEGTTVPTFEGEPIRLRHLVTHTSGLPSLPTQMMVTDPLDPYQGLTEAQVLASLADVELAAAPGSQWEYSNWGFMLLSYVVTARGGQDLEPALQGAVFDPLGMAQAHVIVAPPGVDVVQGHTPALGEVPAWTMPENLAGIGGVKASLDDMVLYAEAALGRTGGPTADLFERSLEPIAVEADAVAMGMAWILLPLEGRTIALHDGGTGGFSSLLLVDRERDRAVVLLSDTAWNVSDDLGVLGAALLDPEAFELPPPRHEEAAPAALVAGLAGRYSLEGVEVELVDDGGTLVGLAEGTALDFGYDSYGDFHPSLLDALLHPVELPGGVLTFDWFQGGVVTRAQRLE